ncbi:MAG: dihydroneopterin aldolase [Alistipes sp.]|nr:dihydroneopterin aldolase [Alistipes sp.]
MQYTITLSDCEFRAFHGCYDLEQKVGNRFSVDVRITAELGDAAEKDAVERTVNYLRAYEVVRAQMAVTQRTIERVAENIIAALYGEFPSICRISCTVAKIAPPLGGKVGRVAVTLER